jgi:4'-phosphopantetheinyl transferase
LRQRLPEASATSWHIATTPKGKPYLRAPYDQIAFSISHTSGLVAVCISDAKACGIDLESLDRVLPVEGLSARYLSQAEQAWLHAHQQADQQRAFLNVWTLKEAYLKALGLGISVPLNSLTFSWGESIRLECAEPSTQALDHWVFDQSVLPSGHLLAVAQEGPCSALEIIEVILDDEDFRAKD